MIHKLQSDNNSQSYQTCDAFVLHSFQYFPWETHKNIEIQVKKNEI